MNKNRVINSITDSREIKETKSSDSLLSHGLDDVVMNRKIVDSVLWWVM